MGCLAREHQSFWQDVSAQLEPARPSVGKRVRSTTTRGKNVGRVGTVIRHEIDRFDGSAYRYGSDASHHMRDMAGTYGWRVQVRCDDGATFWLSAMRVEVLP